MESNENNSLNGEKMTDTKEGVEGAAYVSLEPNYSNMFARFSKDIVPEAKGIIRALDHEVPYRSQLSREEFATVQMNHKEKMLQRMNGFASSISIALASATSVEQVCEVQTLVAEANTLFNVAFNKTQQYDGDDEGQ